MSPTLDRRRAIVSLAGVGVAGIATTRAAIAQGTPDAEPVPADEAVLVVTATGSASAPATHAIAQIVIRANYGAEPIRGSVRDPRSEAAGGQRRGCTGGGRCARRPGRGSGADPH